MSLFNHYYNVAKKDSLLNENISHYQNLEYSFSLNKEIDFFQAISNIHIIKKFIDYINEEYKDLNKQEKSNRRKVFLQVETFRESDDKNKLSEITEKIQDFFDDNLNFFEVKKDIYKFLINEESITLKNVMDNNFEDALQRLSRISIQIFYEGIEDDITGGSYFSIVRPDFKTLIKSDFHDMMHLFYGDKSLDNFYDPDSYVGDLEGEILENIPLKYSPEEMLQEYAALNAASYIGGSFNPFDFFRDKEDEIIKDFILKNKKLVNNYYSDNFINDFLNIIDKVEKSSKNASSDFAFSLQQFKFIKKIYEMMGDKNKTKEYDAIIEKMNNYFISDGDDFNFFDNMTKSIKNITKNKKVTWKIFRSYFKNYPNIIKIFSEKKYPDNLEIKEVDNFKKLNSIVRNFYNVSNLFLRKDIEKNVTSNPDKNISFLFKQIGEMIKKYSLTSHKSEIKLITGLLKK